MNLDNIKSKIKCDEIIRLVVGDSEYPKGKKITNMTKPDYPFNTAAFVVNNINSFSQSSNDLASFRRVLGMIFSPDIAKCFINYWQANNTSGDEIARYLKNNFKVYFVNYSELKNIEDFNSNYLCCSNSKHTIPVKALILTTKAFDFNFNIPDIQIFKYTHPSTTGNTQQLFSQFDYLIKENEFSSACDIINGFQFELH